MKNINEENIQRIDFIKQHEFCDFILINRQSNKKFYDPTHLETMDAIGRSNLCNGIVSLVVLTIGHLVIIVSKMRNSLSSEVKAKDRWEESGNAFLKPNLYNQA